MKNLKPGPETDRLVAGKIMGWLVVKAGTRDWFDTKVVRFPCYAWWKQGGSTLYRTEEIWKSQDWSPSRNLGDALEVVAQVNPLWFEIGRESCCGVRYDLVIYDDPNMNDKIHETVEHLPLGICQILLEFVEKRNGKGKTRKSRAKAT